MIFIHIFLNLFLQLNTKPLFPLTIKFFMIDFYKKFRAYWCFFQYIKYRIMSQKWYLLQHEKSIKLNCFVNETFVREIEVCEIQIEPENSDGR